MSDHSSSSKTSPFQRRYPPELRERAVRLVAETAAERGDRHGAVTLVARQLGIGPESVRKWVQQAEVDRGDRGGLTTDRVRRVRVAPARPSVRISRPTWSRPTSIPSRRRTRHALRTP